MAGNNSIQILRGSSVGRKSSGSTLLPGQPFYEWDTHKLYIGGSTSTSIAAAIPVSPYYDTVISNQTEFEAWYKQLDAGTYTGASVLILSGTYTRSDGKGLHLPTTLKQLHGLGTVIINITGFVYSANTNKGGIWYTTTPITKEYSIENISLSCTGTGHSYGFRSCVNLTNCASSGDANTGHGYGFHSCTNLTNCTGYGESSYNNGYGFHSCTNLTNCAGDSHSDSGDSYGFELCTNLTNCAGYSDGDGDGFGFESCTNLTNCTGFGNAATADGFGFSSCTNLINCTGSGHSDSGDGYSFSSCKICSNCRQDPDHTSTTTTWGYSNTNISRETCPQYI